MNSVKLYSNGTGVFDRVYYLVNGQPLQISLPIRNDSLDEAVASIGVFGDVTLTEPPSYTPIGYNTASLNFDPLNVTRDLATKLRGARVTLRVAAETVSGRIAGIQEFREASGETVIDRYRLALFDAEGALRTFADREILSLKFTEESVQEEIDKALQRAFETIKPNSTFVNLTLAPQGDGKTEAHVQYAIAQLGAWKISYRLREMDGAWELEGQAVVDNSTDEPWDDFLISVVTGEPISFATDLAEIRPVYRSRVNVVADQAQGVVLLEEGLPNMAMDVDELGGAYPSDARGGLPAAPAQFARAATLLSANSLAEPPARPGAYRQRAQQETAQVRDVADAVEYTAPFPVSIGANRSAIIPLFSAAFKDAQLVLVYKRDRNPDRPYRAIRFTNTTAQSLSHGVCTVFQEGAYVGKAILEATKPGEERILPYAVESGVRIFPESRRPEARHARIQVSKGVVFFENVTRSRITYKIKNNKPEAFRLEIEHRRELADSKLDVKVGPSGEAGVTAIPSGARISVDLPANGAIAVTVTETLVQETQLGLKGTGGAQWLQNLIATEQPLGRHPAVQECLRRQQAVDRARQALADAELQIKDILDEQERLKGLLKAGGHEGAANEWRTTLAENERLIKAAKQERIPQLRQAIRQAEEALEQELSALSLTWSETPEANETTTANSDE